MSEIGENIYKLRERERLSQDELAEKLDVSRQTISNWETGRAKPDIEKIVLLCRLFNLSTDQFLLDKTPAVSAEYGAERPAAPQYRRERISKRKLIYLTLTAAAAMIILAVLAVIILAIDSETATANLLTVEVSIFIGLLISSGLFFIVVIAMLILLFLYGKK